MNDYNEEPEMVGDQTNLRLQARDQVKNQQLSPRVEKEMIRDSDRERLRINNSKVS